MLKGYERAAAVLSLLGEELSQKILSYLPESEAVSMIAASEKLKTPTKEALLDVVSEFNDFMLDAKKTAVAQPEEVPEKTEVEAMPPSQAALPLDIISKASPHSLAKALEVERPEISAYVLSHMPVEKIYETLNLLKVNKESIEAKLLSIKDVPIAKELEEKILKNISERLA